MFRLQLRDLQQGIPLRIVLRGIADAFEAHAHSWGRARKVGSLRYCEAEVDRARERWDRALGEGGEPGGKTSEGACGGGPGIMEAANRGAQEAGGLTVGILPGADAAAANPYVDLPIATGMGQARNVILVLSADAVIAIAGEAGTLSEIALALKLGRPVVGLGTWRLTRGDGRPEERIRYAGTPEEAVRVALELAERGTGGGTETR